eukprot:CAMPEP_0119052570 /NCGR_PEP_ID=MMETSP1177-20130426/73828_1 /TAXON_ID=2985 /ORGANISM="Ochromonas sp, Strain CCMP1899" /LENGTH=425 /DNA_ID=CAMNT_0007032189 /DNA_START=251 /DNA_END=1528 /DNA_ORIENTATION=-
MPNELQPFHEVRRIINETQVSSKGNDGRFLKHLLSYSDFQFGKEVAGMDYRERSDGERISNWMVDIYILYDITNKLTAFHGQNNSLSAIGRSDVAFPYLERSLSLLSPWLIYLDSNAGKRSDWYSEDQIDDLLKHLLRIHHNMATTTITRRKFDAAEGHCQQCLAYSKRLKVEGEEKTTSVVDALYTYCILRNNQGNLSGAINFAEERYNILVMAYDPGHRQVQEAAGALITTLIRKGDLLSLSDAERYAEVTYSTLRDKKNGIDQNSEEVALGAFNLADLMLLRKGDLTKAEGLARECLRIRSLVYGSNHFNIGNACGLLARVLRQQGHFGDETRGFYERALAITQGNEGADGVNVGSISTNIGSFFYESARVQTATDLKREQQMLGKFHYENGYRIYLKLYGANHPDTKLIASQMARVLKGLQ